MDDPKTPTIITTHYIFKDKIDRVWKVISDIENYYKMASRI